jgi:hypothetical protein
MTTSSKDAQPWQQSLGKNQIAICHAMPECRLPLASGRRINPDGKTLPRHWS